MNKAAQQLSKKDLRQNKHHRDEFHKVPRKPIYIVLDNLECAHNIGTILRMADAVLAEKVFLCGTTITPPSKKMRKGSRGAEKWVPWEYANDTVHVLMMLKKQDINIVALELSDQSTPYYQVNYCSPTCFVVGNESHGVSDKVLALSDQVVHLPMLGMMNSLNVATATSVVLFHYLNTRNYSG